MKEVKRDELIMAFAGTIPVIWLALRIAPLWTGNAFEVLSKFDSVVEPPLYRIEWTDTSLQVILVCVAAYAMGLGIWFSSRRNYRRGEEHGSARWGDAIRINRRYRQHPVNMNKILTQNVRIGFNSFKHKRNLNVLVIGGSGAGKTRFYVKPNVMQANCSMVILDPKGEIIRDTGWLLTKKGYNVKVLDLINMERSHCYNPFVYLRNDNDVQRLVTNLFKATTPKGAQSSEPFWDTAAQMLLLALIFYLRYEAPEEEQNFSMVMEMLRNGSVDEEDSKALSPLDILFEDLRSIEPGHIALKYYDAYHSGSGKTLKSIQITLAARLEKFNLDSVAGLTITDELDLRKLGEEKTALFAIIPDNDTSFNFLISLLYSQLFQQLFELADGKPNKKLPVHVHFLMDEFANLALPDDFEKILSVMRSREVSVSIILQNMAQIKALFEKQWEGILGNVDETVYLGGNEASTHKYISELLGKATIESNSFGRSFGRNGNYTKNDQLMGRELMTPDEVRMMDNRYAILVIRAERPIKDLKYDILQHPEVKLTSDGGAPIYVHGEAWDAKQTIKLAWGEADDAFNDAEEIAETSYVLLSEEDVADELNGTISGPRILKSDTDAELIQDILNEMRETEEINNEKDDENEETQN